MSPELSIGNFAKQLKFIRNKKVKPIIYLKDQVLQEILYMSKIQLKYFGN